MARGKELSPQMRSRISNLHSLGYSYRRIHEVRQEIPLSTIRYTIKKKRAEVIINLFLKAVLHIRFLKKKETIYMV
jgi:hypothetical protein